jgi:hypothetical protein
VDLSGMTFEELKLVAEKMNGFEYDKRTGEKKLRELMAKYLEENPDCLKELPPAENEPKTGEGSGEENTPIPGEVGKEQTLTDKPPIDPPKEGMVKIQSIHRGEISSSVGVIDFGEDGIVEVTAEQAEHFLNIEGYEKC